MKLAKNRKSLLFIAAMLFASNAMAVKPGEEDDKKECKKPKFRDFVPAHKAEVAPESEVSFHVSRGTLLTSIKAEAKGEKMNLDVLNRKTYIQVKTKLPASIREGYARIHVTARAEEGDCMGQDGWLITVKEPGAVSVSEAAPEPATEEVKQ
jgi:hypothetical protein